MTRLSMLCVAFLAACGSSSEQPADASAQADAQQLDAAEAHDAAPADTSVAADAEAVDASAVPDSEVADAASDSGAQVDAEVVANPCASAGGACVATTDFCADTLNGQVTRIACGPSGGICCIPIRPTCDDVGTRSEGWYRSGERDCWSQCEESGEIQPVRAEFCGTVNEGWYTDTGSGCDDRTGRIALDSFACGVVPEL